MNEILEMTDFKKMLIKDDPTGSCHFLSKEKVLIHIEQPCILVVIDCLREKCVLQLGNEMFTTCLNAAKSNLLCLLIPFRLVGGKEKTSGRKVNLDTRRPW